VHLTRDGGKNWTNVTPKGMPEWSLVSLIEASPHDAGTAYIALDCHKLDDVKPYIYKTTDFGKSWTKLVNGIPDGAYVHAVREDPVQKDLLYAGTETGIYISFNSGADWQPFQLNLPQSPIHDLVIKNDDLVVATHGRAFWILDDITPLRQLSDQVAKADVYLYKPPVMYRTYFAEFYDRHQPVGENPQHGAVISYYFKSAPKGEVTLQIIDSQGTVVREFSSVDKKEPETPPEWPELVPSEEKIPIEAGMNRFGWDLRYEGPHKLPGEVMAEFRSRGPMAPPGSYQVRLSAEGKTFTVPLELKMDQRVKVSLADMQKEFDLELKIRAVLSDLHDTVREIRETRVQIRSLRGRLEDARYKSINDSANALEKKVTPIEEHLLQVNVKSSEANLNFPVLIDEQLHGLVGSVEYDGAPTKQQYEAFDALSQQTAPLVAQWKNIRSSDLVALNDMMKTENVPAIYLASGTGEAKASTGGGENHRK